MKELNRAELKNQAKALIKTNYWKMVLAGLVLAFAVGTGVRSTVTYKVDDVSESASNAVQNVSFILALIAAALVIAILYFVNFPLEYGGTTFFLKNSDGHGESEKTLLEGYQSGNLKRIFSTFFFRNFMIFLFTLLLIVPGIIKSYEYYFVSQLAADHPDKSGKELCDLSKQMTMGHKKELFMLDLSFILWAIGNALTAGLLGIFYFYPYKYQVTALAYKELVAQGADPTRPAQA
jgi:uncharacterized membrane protein